MKVLTRPGVLLLNRLSYPRKLLLISCLFLVPLALAIGLLVSETQPRIAFAQYERHGLRYLQALRAAAEPALEHRLRARGVAEGSAGERPAMLAAAGRVSAALESLAALDAELGTILGSSAGLRQLSGHWSEVAALPPDAPPAAVDAAHERLAADFRQLYATVGDRSNLILDPELPSYYLMDAVLLKLPDQSLLLTQAQLQALAAQDVPGDNKPLTVTAGLIANSAADLGTGLAVAFRERPDVAPALEGDLGGHSAAVAAFVAAQERLAATPSPAAAKDLVAAAAAAQSTGFALWDAAAAQLDRLLQERVDGMSRKNALATGVSLALLAGVGYLLLAFYHAVMRTVAQLGRAAEMLVSQSQGTVAQETRDELGDVVRSFNSVAAALVTADHERQAAVEHQARLQAQVIRVQESMLVELSTPLIPITERAVVMPLIGKIDPDRMDRVIRTLAYGVSERRADVVIVDITGVPEVDARVARGLVRAADAATLLGARVLLTGVRADVAPALVSAEVDLSRIETHASLQRGIAAALEQSR